MFHIAPVSSWNLFWNTLNHILQYRTRIKFFYSIEVPLKLRRHFLNSAELFKNKININVVQCYVWNFYELCEMKILRVELIVTKSNLISDLRSKLSLNLRSNLMFKQSIDYELGVSFTTHFSCQKDSSLLVCHVFLTHSVQVEAVKIWQNKLDLNSDLKFDLVTINYP